MRVLSRISEKSHRNIGIEASQLGCHHCNQAVIRAMESVSQGVYAVKLDGGYLLVDESSGYPVVNPYIFMASMWNDAEEAREYAELTANTDFKVVRISISEEEA